MMTPTHCTVGNPTLFLAQTQSASAEPAPSAKELTPEDRDQGFVADQGGTEQTSGAVLLIEAYAAIWLLVFGMIFLSMRRQKKLDARISQLAEELAKARKADGES